MSGFVSSITGYSYIRGVYNKDKLKQLIEEVENRDEYNKKQKDLTHLKFHLNMCKLKDNMNSREHGPEVYDLLKRKYHYMKYIEKGERTGKGVIRLRRKIDELVSSGKEISQKLKHKKIQMENTYFTFLKNIDKFPNPIPDFTIEDIVSEDWYYNVAYDPDNRQFVKV